MSWISWLLGLPSEGSRRHKGGEAQIFVDGKWVPRPESDIQRKRREKKIEMWKNELKKAQTLIETGGLENLESAINLLKTIPWDWTGISESELKESTTKAKKELAKELERLLRYDEAIQLWDEVGEYEEAARVRKLKANLAAPKTEIHGDYVDDRDTIVKDSVLNRSNVGGGSSKAEELREAKSLFEEGLIDDAEFKQMKKEILEK